MGAGLEATAAFRAARRGVAEAEERCVRRFVGEDMAVLQFSGGLLVMAVDCLLEDSKGCGGRLRRRVAHAKGDVSA